jgi:uncharacterized protein with von Willebrand factor type A (vWA) domain
MDRTLTEFIRALRGSHVRISTAESLDAFRAAELVGYHNRALLKDSLAACLSKSELEKAYFDSCFERFFTVQRMHELALTNQEEEQEIENNQIDDGGEGSSASHADTSDSDSNSDSEANNQTNNEISEAVSQLGQMLTSGSSGDFSLALNQAAQSVDISSIRSFTQRGLYGRRMMMQMGLTELEDEIRRKSESDKIEDRDSARQLIQARNVLRAEVKDFVERQLVLFTSSQGEQFREEIIRNMSLNNMELRTFSRLNEIVRKMAKRLVAVHSRRRRVYKRGQLNIKKTLQSNMAYDGALFNLKWKSIKVDRPRVMVICDVSGSVAEVSRFLLMFLYSLSEVMPKVRSFAFSSSLGEVTDKFENLDISEAIQTVLSDWGRGSSDYGESWLDFKRLAYTDIDHRTTIIILGDARNNYRENQSHIFKQISERAKQIIWLNPENKNKWSSGDSVMNHYQPYCRMVETCNTLNHLEKTIDKLLKSAN